jgi:HK97 family phage prohead protease
MSAQSIAFSMPPASLFDTGEFSSRWTRMRRDIAIEHKFASIKFGGVEDDGCFTGYASLFGAVDLGGDVVLPGAFAASLATRGAHCIRMLYQHDPAQPIGVWQEVREDKRGLFVRGKLARDVERGRDVLALMRAGALDGLSIGFRPMKAYKDPRTKIRTIAEADLWEISVVTFPMLPGARVAAVKSRRRAELPDTDHFEYWLTEHAGLTAAQARIVINKGYARLKNEPALPRGSAARLARRLRDATCTIAVKPR